MIAGDLIRQAQASGVELRLVGGKVKAIGPREAVARLIAPLPNKLLMQLLNLPGKLTKFKF